MKINEMSLFNKVEEKFKEELLIKVIKKNYSKGSYIHYDGDHCHQIDFIEEGKIEVEHVTQEGEKRIFNMYQEGDIVGLNLSFSSNQFYIMNFVANTDVKIASISRDDLLSAAQKNVYLLENVLTNLADKGIFVGQKMKKEFKLTIREKLLNLLDAQSRKQKTKSIILPFSKTKIADILGVSRTSISRELRKMEKANLIKVNRNIIELLYE